MKPRPWTPAEDARLAALYPLHTNVDIGCKMGRSEAAVQLRAIKIGLRKPAGYINPGRLLPGNIPWNAGLKGIDIERARAVSDIAQTIINTAKVEVGHLKITSSKGSGFIPELPPPDPGIIEQRLGVTVRRHTLKG